VHALRCYNVTVQAQLGVAVERGRRPTPSYQVENSNTWLELPRVDKELVADDSYDATRTGVRGLKDWFVPWRIAETSSWLVKRS
jgi:hypothetical protein